VQELRSLSEWLEGRVWCSPERHGTLTGVFKSQIDWFPLEPCSIRPTQGYNRLPLVEARERILVPAV
jgi:arsenical resistance protein ArsH